MSYISAMDLHKLFDQHTGAPSIIIDHREVLIDTSNSTDKGRDRGYLGAGTFGEVWKAFWKRRVVAVKKIVLKAKFEETKKLVNELCLLVRTQHPYLLRYYGVCIPRNDELWIVMEYADGGDINVELSKDAKKTPIDWSPKWTWARDVATVLSYLHQRRILHQNLKCSNILFVKRELKISDFGITATLIRANQATDEPKRWQAPETNSSPSKYSEKSDVFSFGMMLGELCREPQREDDVIKEHPQIAQDCPQALQELIEKCLHKSAEQRPTVKQILEETDAQALGDANPSPTPTLIEPRQKPIDSGKHRANRAYFEINYPELVGIVGRDQVRTLTKPPPYPIENANPPEVADKIEIITLHAPNSQKQVHNLESVKYHARLYTRVAEYFHDFYVPADETNYEARIDKIDVICNLYRDQKFQNVNNQFAARFKSLQQLQPTAQDDLQQAYLKHLCESKNLVTDMNANPISAWHAAPTEALDSICWYGLLNLSKLDPGYFGKGIYLTQMPNYGEYYLGAKKDKTEGGSFSLILCWALLGNPLAITKVSLGSEQTTGYSSHYAVVTRKQADSSFISDQDYPRLKTHTTYFPATQEELSKAKNPENKTVKLGDEIVLFDPDQVLPRYIVHYTVVKKQPTASGTSGVTKGKISQ